MQLSTELRHYRCQDNAENFLVLNPEDKTVIFKHGRHAPEYPMIMFQLAFKRTTSDRPGTSHSADGEKVKMVENWRDYDITVCFDRNIRIAKSQFERLMKEIDFVTGSYK